MDESAAVFTPEQGEQLTDVPRKTLSYWARTGLFIPRHVGDSRWLRFKYLYSFRDLVAVRALADLHAGGASLQTLRQVGEALHEQYDGPWSTLRFAVWQNRVLFFDRESGLLRDGTRPPQQAMSFDLRTVVDDLHEKVRRFNARKPEDYGKVDQDRRVMQGTPVVKGTRIPTRAIWEYHAEGYEPEDIREEFPDLTLDDIREAIRYEGEQHQVRTA